MSRPKIFMVFAIPGEAFPRKLDEKFTNICFHILAIWWVEPYKLPVFISPRVLSVLLLSLDNDEKCPSFSADS